MPSTVPIADSFVCLAAGELFRRQPVQASAGGAALRPRVTWSAPAMLLASLLATMLAACGEAGSPPAQAQLAPGASADTPTQPQAAGVVTVDVTALDLIDAMRRKDERVRIVAQSDDPRQQLYCGPGNFERGTQLGSDADHPVVRAPAGSVFEVTVGPLHDGARLRARTLVYTELWRDPVRADPFPVTFRILVDGVEKAAVRSDYILQPGPSEFVYDQLMRTLDVPLPEAAERSVTLRFETTRLDAPEPAAGVPVPELVWWDLAVQQTVSIPRASADRQHSNVLFLLVDTLAASHMSLHGYARLTTPNIDAFAATGLRFDHALSMSSWTLPATASLLTGLPPYEHGVLGEHRSYLMNGLRTWPEALREEGIEGGAFVANTLVAEGNNFQQGFGHWEQANNETAEQLNTRLLAWLDAQPRGSRWFGYVHYMDPHAPYGAPGAARDRFTADAPAATEWSQLMPEKVQRGDAAMPDETGRAQLIALYDAEVAYFDASFGRLLAALQQRGLLEDTLVVLTADHGEELFEHGKWGHGYTLYNELLHVPLVAVGPGIAAGSVRSDPVSTAAVADLLLGMARVQAPEGALAMPPPPASVDSSSLVFSAVRTGLFGPQRNLVSVQDGRRKLIWVVNDDPAAAPEVQCFDLISDPLEQRPLLDCDAILLGAAQEWYRSTAARRLPEAQPENPQMQEALEAIGYVGGQVKTGANDPAHR